MNGKKRAAAAARRKRIVRDMMERRSDSREFRDYKDLVRERLDDLTEVDDEIELRSTRGTKRDQPN